MSCLAAFVDAFLERSDSEFVFVAKALYHFISRASRAMSIYISSMVLYVEIQSCSKSRDESIAHANLLLSKSFSVKDNTSYPP